MKFKLKKSGFFGWLITFLIAAFIVLAIRIFVIEPFYIPSASMENALLEGDYILVNKVTCGSRFPITPLSVPMIDKKWYSDFIQLSGFRVFGEPEINRNDVIVFNYPVEENFPIDHKTKFVKRCIALPGDQISIKNGKISINDSVKENNESLQQNYLLELKKQYALVDLKKMFDIKNIQALSYNSSLFLISINEKQFQQIKKGNLIKSIKKYEDKKELWDETIFPSSEFHHWNANNFGPLYIPKKGAEIELDEHTLPFYKKLITEYENNKLEVINQEIYINGEKTKNYKVKMNYYFVMGDNRDNSMDSRYWGFLPENHIIGKAWLVLFSTDKKTTSVRWNRIFEKVK